MNCDPRLSKAKNGRTEVWTEKYRPERIEDLVGNTAQIDEIEAWFNSYENKDQSIKRALLFSGPPGLGKTTLAHAVLTKHGFKIKEYNASDVRSKRLVKKNLYHLINIASVDKHSEDFKSFGIIMDEVDGMSSGDMGGMAELISFINPTRGKRSVKKEEKTALAQRWIPPIICICNDNTDKKMKELKKDCQEIVFRKPTKKELRIIIDKVAAVENFRITEEAADLVCGQAQGDYRRLLTILQNLVTMAISNYDSPDSDPVLIDVDLVVSQNSIFCSKDLDLHLSEKVNGLFNCASRPDQLLKIYETEKSLLPMMMHENYLDFIPLQIGISDFEKLGNIRETIDSIVLGDIIDKTMYNNQSWHLQEIHGLSSSWVPCFYVNRYKKSAYKKVSFTTALGRFSFQRANQKNINGLVRKINREDTYSLEDVRALSEIILYNLLEPAGNPELGIQYLVEYGLHINDVKDLIKMNKLEGHYAVLHTSRMKTALLKLYTIHMNKLDNLNRPKDISKQFLRDLIVRNERNEINGQGGVKEGERDDYQNLRIKGTDTILNLTEDQSDQSDQSDLISPMMIQKSLKSDDGKTKEKVPRAPRAKVAKAAKVPKAVKVPKVPKVPRATKGKGTQVTKFTPVPAVKPAVKTQSSITKTLSVTTKSASTSFVPPQIISEPKTNSTQIVIGPAESRLKLPPLIVQKPHVTVTIVPPHKTTPATSTIPAINPATIPSADNTVPNENMVPKKIQLRILPKIITKNSGM